MKTFLPILNTLIFELTKRAEAYSQIGDLFSFFSELKTIASDALKKKCKQLVNMYHKDLNYDGLVNECEPLQHYMDREENCETLLAPYRKIILDNLKSVFLNVEIALGVHDDDQLYRRTIFSQLKLIKNICFVAQWGSII